jgi:ribosomal-protein-alanine N-acetyltransferase
MQFETSRLIMRLVIAEDESASLSHWQDPDWTKYICTPLNQDQALGRFKKTLKPWIKDSNERLVFSITLKSNNTLVGELMFRYIPELSGIAEIGYGLYQNYQGQGYAFEATQGLIKYAFEHLAVHKISAGCGINNIASYKLMEKLNMKREACLRQHKKINDALHDFYFYSILKSEYQK